MKKEVFALCVVLVELAKSKNVPLGNIVSKIADEVENELRYESDDSCDLMDVVELVDSLYYNYENASIPDIFDRFKHPFV